MGRASMVFGTLGILLTVGFFALSVWMGTLPYGDNDFDLILIGVFLLAVGVFACSTVVGCIGLVLGAAAVWRESPRWWGIIGLAESAFSLIVVACALWW